MRSLPSDSKAQLILFRGLVWGLIGLIYAPLFLGLLVIFRALGLGHLAFVPAASLACAVGAMFYGARQVGIAGTAVGLSVASVILLTVPDVFGFWGAAGLATLVGGALGWWVEFPPRCSLRVPAKAMAGLSMGALSGGVLALAESLHPFDFRAPATLAFLVSVNGILYVASLSWWLRRAPPGGGRSCNLVEVAVVAILAGLAAGGLWLGAAPLMGLGTLPLAGALTALETDLPPAMVAGVFGGALAGILLESFGFRWVHDD